MALHAARPCPETAVAEGAAEKVKGERGTGAHDTNKDLLSGWFWVWGTSPDGFFHDGIGGGYGQLQVSLPGPKLRPQRVHARLAPV